jgi:hypothetical protein
MLLDTSIWLVASTVALSAGQAWAIAGGDRRTRYALVWIVATAVVVTFSAPVIGFPARRLLSWDSAVRLLIAVGGAVTAVTLWIGAWLTDSELAARPWFGRLLGLAGVHLVVVLVAGVAIWALLIFLVVGRIH